MFLFSRGTSKLKRSSIYLTAALALGFSAEARAQALSAPMVGTGLSSPTTSDPAAVFHNPAMLTGIERPTFLVGGMFVLGDIRYRRERRAVYQREDSLDFTLPVAPEAIDASKTGFASEARANPFGVVPTLFGAYPIPKSRFVAGLGIYLPYTAMIEFPENGAQRFALQEATIISAFVTPSLAYRINEMFSIGAGLSYVFGFAEMKRVQDFAGLPDVADALEGEPLNQDNDFGPNATPAVRELSVMARPVSLKQGIAHSATFNIGFSAQPVDNLRFGLSYQHSVPMTFHGEFTLDMDDDFFTQDLEARGLNFDEVVKGDSELEMPLPAAIKFGASWELTQRFGLSLSTAYTFWSSTDQLEVRLESPQLAQPEIGLPNHSTARLPRRWLNTIGADLQARFGVSESVSLRATGGYRSSAVPDETIDAASPDGDRIVGGVGASFRFNKRYALLADAAMQTILPRKVVGSDYDLGNGEYSLMLLAFGAHLEVTM